MSLSCPHCVPEITSPNFVSNLVRAGRFYRKSDSRWIQRFHCRLCKKGFSRATNHPCYRQNKRQFNERLKKLLYSGVSQRRAAILLKISRNTVVRKFLFLSQQGLLELDDMNKNSPKSLCVEFDDLETFEHSKCKPLSVTLAVDSRTRRILGFEVSQMPAKGHLAAISRKKYGFRKDHRPRARDRLFFRIKPFIERGALIKSDENPHYPSSVKKHFPESDHKVFKGRRGAIVGQGELKKIGFDPLFSLNHTCAMLRGNINRLFRKTWCTTKKIERLSAHIAIYAVFHNLRIQSQK